MPGSSLNSLLGELRVIFRVDGPRQRIENQAVDLIPLAEAPHALNQLEAHQTDHNEYDDCWKQEDRRHGAPLDIRRGGSTRSDGDWFFFFLVFLRLGSRVDLKIESFLVLIPGQARDLALATCWPGGWLFLLEAARFVIASLVAFLDREVGTRVFLV